MSQFAFNQLKALLLKNILILKRNTIATFAEILFPITLMAIIVIVRHYFQLEEFDFNTDEKDDQTFYHNKSIAALTNREWLSVNTTWEGMQVLPLSTICLERPWIALVGPEVNDLDKLKHEMEKYIHEIDKPFFQKLLGKEVKIAFRTDFKSVDELESYVKHRDYISNKKDYPQVCFGVYYEKIDDSNYNYSLHYYDSNNSPWGARDVPQHSAIHKIYDEFQRLPDYNNYQKYQYNGYMWVMKIVNELILKTASGETNAALNFGMVPQKYDFYKVDTNGSFWGVLWPFFIVIAYMLPLIWYVRRMVYEKETKAKEGMKIMGVSEGVYYISYFIQYLITNIIYSLVCSWVMTYVLKQIPYIVMFSLFFLYGMDVFSLAFFFQSFVDKTRLAMILSLVIYFVMFFISFTVWDETGSNALKMWASILPPVDIQLGTGIFQKFENAFIEFTTADLTNEYAGYKLSNMFMMFTVDFFIYLFIGFYLQNIVSHELGIKRPFYFLFTRSYSCGLNAKNNNKACKAKIEMREVIGIKRNNNWSDEKLNLNNPNFESEDWYMNRTKRDDVLKIRNMRKEFGPKIAVDNVSLNWYKNEIFALLGHNGAGKSTLISMLCGLYEATDGSAIYNEVNIWDHDQMEIFRHKMGICPQNDIWFDDWSIREHLNMFCSFKGVKRLDIERE